MKHALLMLGFVACLCLVGCESQEQKEAREKREAAAAAARQVEQEKEEAEYRAKIESLKKQKILNIRVTDTTMDFILEDGSIVTLYSYVTTRSNGNGGYTSYSHLAVK